MSPEHMAGVFKKQRRERNLQILAERIKEISEKNKLKQLKNKTT